MPSPLRPKAKAKTMTAPAKGGGKGAIHGTGGIAHGCWFLTLCKNVSVVFVASLSGNCLPAESHVQFFSRSFPCDGCAPRGRPAAAWHRDCVQRFPLALMHCFPVQAWSCFSHMLRSRVSKHTEICLMVFGSLSFSFALTLGGSI
eukprot:5578699-Amphidinium_carterae.1